jgi:hypothetical protein
MTKPKGHQLMFSVNMFANTIVVDPMQVGLENQLHIFSELVRLVGELVDFKKTLVLQSLLDAINKQAKNGQDALNNAEANFVDLAKANPQLQGMVNDYIGYYDSPKKLFEQMDNADEVTQVKRLASLIF